MIICDKCGAKVPDYVNTMEAGFPPITIIKTTRDFDDVFRKEKIHLCEDCKRDFFKWLTNDYVLNKRM